MRIFFVIILAAFILLSGCNLTGADAAYPEGSVVGDPTVEGRNKT